MPEKNLLIVMKAKDLVSKTTGKISGAIATVGAKSKKVFAATARFAKSAGRAIKTMLGPLALITSALGALSGAAFFAFINSAAKGIDTIGKFSDRLGLSTEFLSELRHVADLSGVKVEALNVGFQRVTRRMAEFAATGGGAAANAIKALGLEDLIRQGKTIEEILPQMADGFARLNTDAEKVSAAFGLFDSEGVSFLQFLNKGSTEIERLRNEARQFGIVIGDESAKKAANFNDQLSTLFASLRGLKFSIGLAFFDDMAKAMREMAFFISRHKDDITEVIGKVARIGKTLVEGVFAAFGDRKKSAALAEFIGKSMLEIFRASGRSAAIGFAFAFGSNLQPLITNIITQLGGWLSRLPDVAGFKIGSFGSGIAALSNAGGLDLIGDNLTPKVRSLSDTWKEAGKNIVKYNDELVKILGLKTKPAVEKVDELQKVFDEFKKTLGTSGPAGSGQSAPIEEGGFFAILTQGFRDQAERIKATFENLKDNAGRFADDLHRSLSSRFFDLAKRQFKNFAQFVKDVFTDIIDSILSILSDALASQVVNAFGELLGGFFKFGGSEILSGATSSDVPIFGPSAPPGGGSSLGGGIGFAESSAGQVTTFNPRQTIIIQAIDGASVAAFVEKHGGTLAGGIASAVSQNNSIKADLKGALG